MRQEHFPRVLHAVRRGRDEEGEGNLPEPQWAGRLRALRSAIDKESGSVKAKVAGVETKIAGVQAQVSGVETKVAGVQAQVAGVETKVAGVQAQVAGVQEKIAGLNQTVGDKMTALEQKIEELLRRLPEQAPSQPVQEAPQTGSSAAGLLQRDQVTSLDN